MSDSDETTKQAPSIPSWQQAASQPASDLSSETSSPENTLERASQFLQDEEVRNASRERKVEFLKSKGLGEEDITQLLDKSTQSTTTASSTPTTISDSATTTPPSPPPPPPPPPPPQPTTTLSPSSTDPDDSAPQTADHPPIVTYPEFLTKPLKPPPLLTASGLFNSLAVIAGASTLVYGATKHLISPMVESLTAARIELHDAADANLSRLVGRLEEAVSEIPAGYGGGGGAAAARKSGDGTRDDASSSAGDDESSYDDPSELFHRDVGVQTSPQPPSTPTTTPANPFRTAAATNTTTAAEAHENPTQHQADRLARLSVAVRGLAADAVHRAESMSETKTVLDAFATDLHGLTWPADSFSGGTSFLYGSAVSSGSNEPDDEIRRAKATIRSVKGVLLSTRTFPATIRYGLE